MAVPTEAFPGFELLGALGRGTTGIVYDARDTRLNRRVALKVPVLAPESERTVRAERFLREARALAYLSGRLPTGIPTLHMVGEHQGQPYYARELVDGATLERLATVGSIGLRAGLAIVAEVARVVQWVHEQGFTHRNLSAANVLVARDGTPRLIGFGRVRSVSGAQLLPGGDEAPAGVDVRGLQELLRSLCGALRESVPTGLEHALAPGAVPTAGALGEAVAGCL